MEYERMFRLDGKRVLVVGAGRGIGEEAARALAAQGADVICADADNDAATATAGACGGSAYDIDILEPGSVARAAEALDPIDVLLFTPATNVRKRLLDYTREEYDRVIALNLGGAFELIRSFGAGMVQRGRGSIIGYSSIRGLVVEPGQGVYAATKAGLVQMIRTAAAEFGTAGVRVNAIAPGVVDTPLTAQIKAQPDWYDAYAKKNALGRWAAPSEIAGAAVFLASDAASYVTGSVLFVDGGWTAIDGRFDPPS